MSAESLLSVIAAPAPVPAAAAAASAAESDAGGFAGILAEAIGGDADADDAAAPAETQKSGEAQTPAGLAVPPPPVTLVVATDTAPTTDGGSHTSETPPVPGTGLDFAKVLEDTTGPQVQPDPTLESHVEICPPADGEGKTLTTKGGDAETRPTLPPVEPFAFDPPPVPFKFASRGLPAPGGPVLPQTFSPPVETGQTTTKTTGPKDGRQVLPGMAPLTADAPVDGAFTPAAPSAVSQPQSGQTPGAAPPTGAALQVAPDMLSEPAAKPLDAHALNTGAATAPAADAAASADVAAASLSSLSRATIETTAHIAAQITRKLEGRSTRFEMALTPEGLGRVDVSLDIDADGQLAARLAFDNPVAAMDMRGRVDELRRQLEDQGFKLSDDALQFTDRDPQSRGDGFDGRRQNAFARSNRLADDADLELGAPVAGRWMSLSLTPDRVDLKV